MIISNYISNKNKCQEGITSVYFVLMIVVFIGIAAFVIDIGYQMVVRNQLQNAADAAALAGCNRLFRDPTASPAPAPAYDKVTAWPPAWDECTNFNTYINNTIALNSSDNRLLVNGTIATGWWDVTHAYQPDQWSTPPTTCPPSSSPPSPASNYAPAVRVTINKTAGQNSGPIASFFGNIFGVSSTDSTATSTAVAYSLPSSSDTTSGPGSVRSGALIPFAMSKAITDNYNNYNSTAPIKINPDDNGTNGQWTSFREDDNDVTSVRKLISEGNRTQLNIDVNNTNDNDDFIWIEPGTKATLYDNTNQPSLQNTYAGKEVICPIVVNVDKHSSVPLVGFIGFHLICAGTGCKDNPYYDKKTDKLNDLIMGYFTTEPAYAYGEGGMDGSNIGGGKGLSAGTLCRLCR